MAIDGLEEYYGTGHTHIEHVFQVFQSKNWILDDIVELGGIYEVMSHMNFKWGDDYQNVGGQVASVTGKEYYIPNRYGNAWLSNERFVWTPTYRTCYFTKDHYTSFLCILGGRNVSHIRVYANVIGDRAARNKQFYIDNGQPTSYEDLTKDNKKYFTQQRLVWVESYNI